MYPLLTAMGVPHVVQEYFCAGGLVFPYLPGGETESFTLGFHYQPTTKGISLTGPSIAKELILTYSVMEAIAWLTFNYYRYPYIDGLTFAALGNYPRREQVDLLRRRFPRSKVTLVFGKDLTGRAADVIVGAAWANLSVRLILEGESIRIICGGREVYLPRENLTLNTFQKAFGIRSLCRTSKPARSCTFLEQLMNPSSDRSE